MGPIATGLGRDLHVHRACRRGGAPADGRPYDATALRTLQDWVIRPQLRQVPGVTEVNTIGGFEKQYHVTPDPAAHAGLRHRLRRHRRGAAEEQRQRGAGYIERNGEQYLIRSPGQVADIAGIEQIIVDHPRRRAGARSATWRTWAIGKELRTGAATRDGEETVLGTAVMLIGENSRTVSKARGRESSPRSTTTLPEGVTAETVYDRTIAGGQDHRHRAEEPAGRRACWSSRCCC